MRDWGRKRAVDRCLAEYEVDVIMGPGDSRINELSSAAGRKTVVWPHLVLINLQVIRKLCFYLVTWTSMADHLVLQQSLPLIKRVF
jgi:hypothetical protein